MFKGQGPKILLRNKRLQRLPILLAQVEAGKLSESLLNEITKMIDKNDENLSHLKNNVVVLVHCNIANN